MPHIADLLALESPERKSLSTGFGRLDELTGGFCMGGLWVVTGTPGQGCTTLLTHWAVLTATEHALPTWLLSPREDEHHTACRVVSARGKVPTGQLLTGELAAVDAGRLNEARAALSSSQLFLRCGPHLTTPTWDEPGDKAVVIDDVDLVLGSTPLQVRRAADSGAVVVVSLPRHLLVQNRHAEGDLDPEWARVADVILEVRSRRLESESNDERLGEAEVTVLKHRRGPTTSFAVSFQPHYSRFVDLRE